MPDTLTPRTLLSTPAEVAAAVLDGIENYPGSFDMENWARLTDIDALQPDRAPTCGTAMCVAGWAAHVTGWTLVDAPYNDDQDEEPVLITDSQGLTSLEFVTVYAKKDGVNRLISDVARDALGLTQPQTFWHARPAVALQRLRQIAGR